MTERIKKNKKVHFIGICGSGMSALAVLFKESGAEVTGTDENAFEPMPSYLKKNKILFFEKYNEKNIPKDVDLVIVGNNAPLSAEENPETRYAVKSNLKIQSLPEALAMISQNTENTVVVGSSGKSSMTGLIAWCLFKAKKDPSYFIGALPLDLENSSHLGKGRDFILEGDEYTSSKTDRRSKFLHFNPTSVLLISAKHDHINIFPTEESYKKPYKKLMAKIPKNGLLVYALYGKNNKEIAKYANCRTVSYSSDSATRLEKADWYAENIKYGINSSFDLIRKEKDKSKKIATIKTKLLGKHNIENIIGAGALLLETKKITVDNFVRAVDSFHGIKNRIELKTINSTVPVYEGFGSSYEKAKSIFDTMRLHFKKHRIIAIFEPYSFSWRNRKFLKWYKDIFDNVDEVIMLPATGHGKKAKDQLTTAEVWREVKKHKNVKTADGEKDTIKIVNNIVKKDDVIALVSSGTMFGLTDSIPKLMDRKFPK